MNDRPNRRCRNLEWLFSLFFMLIILEGVIRKWIVPGGGIWFVLIRDPIVLFMLWNYFQAGLKQDWLIIWLISCAILGVLILFQMIIGSETLFVALMAFRYYLYYIPVAFIVGNSISEEFFRKWLRMVVWCAFPVSVLVVLQFYSPLDSVLNAGISLNDFIFQVVDGVVRPYGPFTFSVGQSMFSVLCLAIGFILISEHRESHIPKTILALYWFAIFAMGAVSGSRTYFIYAIPVVICYVAAEFLSGSSRVVFRSIMVSVVAVGSFLVVFIVVLPQAFQTMSERQEDAVYDEGSVEARILHIGTEFVSVLDDTPFLGYGAGVGINSGSLLNVDEGRRVLAEYEWTRLTQELGPLLGSLVILLRIVVTGILGWKAVLHAKQGNRVPLILFGIVGPLLMISQITSQNTILSLTWFCLGMMLAAMRIRFGASVQSKSFAGLRLPPVVA